jgi:hypothetical protein
MIETSIQMTEREINIINRIEEIIHTEGASNDFLVSILKLSEQYLNLKRVSEMAEIKGHTTQWVRKSDKVITICGYQLIPNND